jgi:hypothetical protein
MKPRLTKGSLFPEALEPGRPRSPSLGRFENVTDRCDLGQGRDIQRSPEASDLERLGGGLTNYAICL